MEWNNFSNFGTGSWENISLKPIDQFKRTGHSKFFFLLFLVLAAIFSGVKLFYKVISVQGHERKVSVKLF